MSRFLSKHPLSVLSAICGGALLSFTLGSSSLHELPKVGFGIADADHTNPPPPEPELCYDGEPPRLYDAACDGGACTFGCPPAPCMTASGCT